MKEEQFIEEQLKIEVAKLLSNADYDKKMYLRDTTDNKYILEYFSNSKYEPFRIGICFNPNIPTYLLVKLADDKKYRVRQAVAFNPKTPVFVLKILANDVDLDVQMAVSVNQNTPRYIVDKIVSYQRELLS